MCEYKPRHDTLLMWRSEDNFQVSSSSPREAGSLVSANSLFTLGWLAFDVLEDSPASVSHFTVGTLGLQMRL